MTKKSLQNLAGTGNNTGEMQKLIEQNTELNVPAVGQFVEGKVLSARNNEVYIDVGGLFTGVVRGPELFDESGRFTNLKPGDAITAAVIERENELGTLELSFRLAGHKKAWEELNNYSREGKVVEVSITDANKGGLIAKVGFVMGFLPVSQLSMEHYPRVDGGNKSKILERLKTYIGKTFKVRIYDVDEGENKLILSEKAAKLEEQSALLAKFKVGDIVEGRVTGVVDFGAFVEFDDGLEGLVHISELAWQRIENTKDVVQVGQKVKAQIISLDKGKISLSLRRLEKDPWEKVVEKYKTGDIVEGKVLKVSPFGAFVELDADIHGLAHISELAWQKIHSPQDVLKVGETNKFKIIGIDASHHRLGLSLKQLQPKPKEEQKASEPTTPPPPLNPTPVQKEQKEPLEITNNPEKSAQTASE